MMTLRSAHNAFSSHIEGNARQPHLEPRANAAVNNKPGTFCKGTAILGCALMAVAQMQNASAADGPDGVAVMSSPVAGLSQPRVAACSEEIRRARGGWKYWPGDASDAAARLGRFHKELFEGRCKGHPQAQAYIAGANRMLGYGANAAVNEASSSGSLLARTPMAAPGTSMKTR